MSRPALDVARTQDAWPTRWLRLLHELPGYAARPSSKPERPMTTRRASCSCGQLHLTCEGEPVRISMCHCLACQQRTGSVFGVQARFRRDQVTAIAGRSAEYDARRRQRQRRHIPVLSGVRIDGLLGTRRVPGCHRRRCRRLRRPGFSRAAPLRLRVTPARVGGAAVGPGVGAPGLATRVWRDVSMPST